MYIRVGAAARRAVMGCALTVLLAAPRAESAPIVIAGTAYDTVDFADTLLSSGSTGGAFSVNSGTLANAVTGSNINDWAFCNCDSAFVELGFTDNVVFNGAGADLRLFEIGTPDDFGISLTIAGVTQTIVSASTGFTEGSGFGINLANIDLSLFGIAPGATVNSIVVRMGFPFGNTSNSPTLAGVTALNSRAVPEPGLMLLLGTGAAALARRRLRRS
jgi:hypothetical protein